MKYKKEQQLEILFHLYSVQMDELMFRREREFKIFAWSNSLFVATIGVLAVAKKSETVLLDSFSWPIQAALCGVILLLMFLSVAWQNRERGFANANSRVISDINALLNVFEPGGLGMQGNTTLYPLHWKSWGTSDPNSLKRYFRANLITATWVLATTSVLMIFIS